MQRIEEALSYFTKDYKQVTEAFVLAIKKSAIGNTPEYEYGMYEVPTYTDEGEKTTKKVPTKQITTSDGVTITFTFDPFRYRIYIR